MNTNNSLNEISPENNVCENCKSSSNDYFEYIETEFAKTKEIILDIRTYLPENKQKNCNGFLKDLDEVYKNYKKIFFTRKVCEHTNFTPNEKFGL